MIGSYLDISITRYKRLQTVILQRFGGSFAQPADPRSINDWAEFLSSKKMCRKKKNRICSSWMVVSSSPEMLCRERRRRKRTRSWDKWKKDDKRMIDEEGQGLDADQKKTARVNSSRQRFLRSSLVLR